MDVSYLFAGIGMIILIGFMGSLFFERTKIPDVLILIFMGLMIGPILTDRLNLGLIDEQMMEALDFIAPSFAALALVIILFDGGLNLNLEKTMKKLGLAILHTGICFIGSVVATALICVYILDLDLAIGLLLGCIIGGTSGAVVIPIMMRSCANEDTQILLTLESVLTDVLCIVGALIFLEVIKGTTLETGALIQRLLSQFILAGFIAFLFGVFWLMVLKKLEGKPFAFMVTIAALLVLYAMAEFIEVSGAIAALVFGLVLSNKDEIARILKFRGSFVLDENIKQFHSEVSFLVRTFFFVYLGLTFTFTMGTFDRVAGFIPHWISWHPLLVLTLLLILLYCGILLVRYIAATVTTKLQKESREDKPYIYSMMPRGLAAAVLAALPFTISEWDTNFVDGMLVAETNEYYTLMSPHQTTFMNVTFMIIIITVISTTIGVSIIERRRAAAASCPTGQESGGDWTVKSPTYRKALESGSVAPAAKASPTGKEGPKPWVDPHAAHGAAKAPATKPASPTPAKQHHVPARPVGRRATAPPPRTVPAKKAVPPPKKTAPAMQSSKPAATRAVPVKPSKPHRKQGAHPLVKRAAESEKAVPAKKAKK